MARINLDEVKTPALDELIPQYASDKKELGGLKKNVDLANAQIKDLMFALGVEDYTAGGYTAKRIVTHKESVDEAMLLSVVKAFGLPAVKTVEVVDTDALEAYLYTNDMTPELAEALDKCRKVSEVIQLRIGKEKKKKEED